MTAAIRSTWSLRWKLWSRYLTAHAADAAPLLCAGLTTFNSLRHSGALPGDLVAVQGIGGLGHLGIQYAAQVRIQGAGCRARVRRMRLSQRKLGANVYIDSNATNAAEELQRVGGAQVILTTAPSSKAMSSLIDGLGPNGKLIVLGAAFDPIEVTPIQLISGSQGGSGMVNGNTGGCRGHSALLRTDRDPPDDRDLSARTSGPGVRENVERRCAISCRPDDVIPAEITNCHFKRRSHNMIHSTKFSTRRRRKRQEVATAVLPAPTTAVSK